eukprot:GFYU01000825.1.p1 GENE.GFYU01000825.1~~GFYU01000825.1.p1  ORF type:complete len:248 (-),score=72.57 GFYU01000825.1:174-917(-)
MTVATEDSAMFDTDAESINDHLGEDLIYHIFSFLDAQTLLKAASVCKMWNELSEDDTFWKELCGCRWEGKFAFRKGEPALFWNAAYRDSIKSLSVKELKHVLASRGVDHIGCTEKSEYQLLVTKTNPIGLPAWCNKKHRKWKTAFLGAEYDAKRTAITKKELCETTWLFKMKSNFYHPHFNPSPGEKFKEDGSYVSEFHPELLDWKFVGDGLVQVSQYPPLKVNRTGTWGYELENDYVVFECVSRRF